MARCCSRRLSFRVVGGCLFAESIVNIRGWAVKVVQCNVMASLPPSTPREAPDVGNDRAGLLNLIVLHILVPRSAHSPFTRSHLTQTERHQRPMTKCKSFPLISQTEMALRSWPSCERQRSPTPPFADDSRRPSFAVASRMYLRDRIPGISKGVQLHQRCAADIGTAVLRLVSLVGRR